MEKITLSELKVTYTQDTDSCDEDGVQELTVFTQDAGGGKYLVIETKRWAINDIDEVVSILNDFQKRIEPEELCQP